MRIFVVRDKSEPVLIAPWMLSRASRNALPATHLGFIDHPESQVADVICLESPKAEEGFNCLLRYLANEISHEWDMLCFDKLPRLSPFVQWLDKAQPYSSNRYPSRSNSSVLVIPLAGTWEDYLRSRSARFRKTLRNIANRIQRLGKPTVTCFRGKELSAETIAKLFSIADASWKLQSGVAITSSMERKRFFEEIFASTIAAESLRVWILEVNGNAIATETQVVDESTIYALRSDYDDRYSDSSPGVYLQMEMLKNLFGGPQREYNFGVGLNPYKARWTEQSVDFVSFRFFNRTHYGRLLRLLDRCKLQVLSFRKDRKTVLGKES